VTKIEHFSKVSPIERDIKKCKNEIMNKDEEERRRLSNHIKQER
jgi:hypothetical protein